MANKTVTVKSSGGDYTSLNAAFAGEDDTGDLVTNTCILTIECYAMEDTTTADTGTGYTTSASYYINVTVPAAARHAGVWNAAKYILHTSADNHCLIIREAYTRIDGLQISVTVGSANYSISTGSGAGGDTYITNNIIKNTNSSGRGIYIGAAGNYYIYNNLLYDIAASGSSSIYFTDTSSLVGYVYNNTIWGCLTGIKVIGDTPDTRVTAKNNIYQSDSVSGADGYVGADVGWAASDYNISDIEDDTEYVSASYREGLATTVTFVDTASDNYGLGAADSSAKDQGVDLSGTFTVDIAGTTRSGTWDIGAFNYAAAGGVPNNDPFIRPFMGPFGRAL